MQENNGKNFIWLFVGLFVVLFGFALFNEASGKTNKNVVSVDEMIKSIVQSDAVLSDLPNILPEESDVPEELVPYLRIEKERAASHKMIGDLIYFYNPNTNISSLYYYSTNGSILLYNSSEGIQFSDETFAPFREKIEQTYKQTL
ncbi:hypothetical protein [Defluviitalea phaphyphila]|uniref:hypothetical protein n=1 Tax=Defluviitalea phaphyphila TaxID=1473580 RepID=UPI0007317290|nr:hypothetical protein [Defluviitalea phaphyphila]